MTKEDIAVRVEQVSKMYRLWNSRRARLAFPLKQLVNTLIPARWQPKKMQPQGYREFNALSNITFDIKKGESWGLIGVNGSGKSTLLKMISGNLRPSAGRIEVDGKTVILDYGSGFNGEFTGKENIYIKAALMGLTRKQINQRYQSIIDFADIGDFIHQPVKTYSSGMISRLGFAIMAHVDADIIITDEALAVGDVFFVQKCMKFIREFLKKGTFLFVSHSTNDVVSLCQKAIWLEHGAIRAMGTASKVARAYLNRKNLRHTHPLVFADDESEADLLLTDGGIRPEVVLAWPASCTQAAQVPLQQKKWHDARMSYLNRATKQIDMPFFDMDSHKEGGDAVITNVALYDEHNKLLTQVVGGELVKLHVEVIAKNNLQSPVVLFQVLDRLGQVLFADNSYLSSYQQPFSVQNGATFTTIFTLDMPLLPAGSYVVRAAVASVSDDGKATMLHTVNNVLAIHCAASGPRHGLIGIPMLSIKVKCKYVANEL